MRPPALRITPGFWLLLAGTWWLDPVLLLPALLAAAVHELGHCAALKALGGRVSQLRLSALGAELAPDGLLSYAQELPVALAGPGASLLCAGVCAHLGRYLLAGLSLALGLFNLLPIGPLDGGRTIRAALSWLAGPDRGDRLSVTLGRAAAVALAGAGAWVLLHGGSFTFLLFALWLLLWREGRD